MEKRDYLAWAALISALVVTASAEWALAVACGFSPWIAAGVPASLDIYAVRSLRAKRDVPYVVISMIIVQALAHLVAAGMLSVSVPLVVLVSSVAPLVLWRVHALGTQTPVSLETRVATDSDSQGLTEVSTQVNSEHPGTHLRTHPNSVVSTELSTAEYGPGNAESDQEQQKPTYGRLRAIETLSAAPQSPTESETHQDLEPDSEVSTDSGEVSTGKLSDSEARRVIEQCFREGVSTRKTAEFATRSQTHVSRVFRELKAA